MPHYYLHLHDAHVDAADDEGDHLVDLKAAYASAVTGIRGFVAHEAMDGNLDFRGRIDIVDDNGNILQTVTFEEAFTIFGLSDDLNRQP